MIVNPEKFQSIVIDNRNVTNYQLLNFYDKKVNLMTMLNS